MYKTLSVILSEVCVYRKNGTENTATNLSVHKRRPHNLRFRRIGNFHISQEWNAQTFM